MKREDTDFHTVRAGHTAIHGRLLNWARWTRSHSASPSVQPMFRGYRPYAYPEAQGGGMPIDTLDAVGLQKLMHRLPEKHRLVIQWSYVFPFLSPFKVCRHLAVSKSGLAELVHDGRTMLKNQSQQLDNENPAIQNARKFDTASAASASRREALASKEPA